MESWAWPEICAVGATSCELIGGNILEHAISSRPVNPLMVDVELENICRLVDDVGLNSSISEERFAALLAVDQGETVFHDKILISNLRDSFKHAVGTRNDIVDRQGEASRNIFRPHPDNPPVLFLHANRGPALKFHPKRRRFDEGSRQRIAGIRDWDDEVVLKVAGQALELPTDRP